MAANLLLLLLLLLATSCSRGSPLSEAVSCHVCGSGVSGDLFPGQPPPPACQLGDLPPPRRCPDQYRGCLTVYDGAALTRTCERQVFDSCKVVNKEVYCYCGGTLCNSQGVAQLQSELGATTSSTSSSTTTTRTRCRTDDADLDSDLGDGPSGDGDPWRAPCEQEVDLTTTTTTRSTTKSAATNNDDLSFVGSSSEEATSTESGGRKSTSGSAPGSASGLQTTSVVWLLLATCAVLRIRAC